MDKSNKMLIDATHPEETRVVVLRNGRVEEFDYESAARKPLRGNIYLAKVTRVEPSLQAAFVDYGGNRHGFLAFSEIHPDYYQIPVADRQALIAQEEHDHRAADGDAENSAGPNRHRVERSAAPQQDSDVVQSDPIAAEEFSADTAETQPPEFDPGEPPPEHDSERAAQPEESPPPSSEFVLDEPPAAAETAAGEEIAAAPETDAALFETVAEGEQPSAAAEGALTAGTAPADAANANGEDRTEEAVESVGGADALEEVQERLPRFRRQYKIQEVIKRRQVLLVQVV